MPVTVIGVPYHLDEYLPELGVLALDAAVGEPDVDHLQQPRLARSRALRLSVTMAASGEGPVPATSPCGNPASSLVVRRVTSAVLMSVISGRYRAPDQCGATRRSGR